MITCHVSFTIESENQKIICEDKTFTTFIYCRTTLKPMYRKATYLVELVHILTAFYYLLISLVLFTPSLIDASKYAQVRLNYTLN